jgi:hypothetical protein
MPRRRSRRRVVGTCGAFSVVRDEGRRHHRTMDELADGLHGAAPVFIAATTIGVAVPASSTVRRLTWLSWRTRTICGHRRGRAAEAPSSRLDEVSTHRLAPHRVGRRHCDQRPTTRHGRISDFGCRSDEQCPARVSQPPKLVPDAAAEQGIEASGWLV